MSAFDDLDALVLDAAQAAFGTMVTLYPMKPGSAGLNGAIVAESGEGARPILTGVHAIRSEWSERGQIGGNGMPTPPGAMKLAFAGVRHIATVKPEDLGWTPRKGDELEYDDRPGTRYRVAEPMPDGGAGLHLGLTRI